jgi:hypothetical protein
VGANHPGDAPIGIDDHRLHAVVVGDLLARGADEGQHVLGRALALDPRHPPGELVTIGVDDAVELLGVGLLEQAQRLATRQLVAKHQTFASNASSAS